MSFAAASLRFPLRLVRLLQHRRRPLLGSFRFGRHRQKLAALRAPIASCNTRLLEFGNVSDRAYTELTRGIGGFHANLVELKQHNTAFQLVLEDRDDDRPVHSAHEVYKRAVDLFHSSIGIAVTESSQLEAVEQSLRAACQANAHFHRHSLMLRIITMRIRMEAAQMPPEYSAIFLNVASAIGGITDRIATCTHSAFERIEAIITEIESERTALQQIETELQRQAESSIQAIRSEVGSLQKSLEPCAAQGREIATQLTQSETLVYRLIASIQHQDIVRQQLEHVTAGFTDLGQHLEIGFDPKHPAPVEPSYIQRVATVQQAQLNSARQEIENATQEIIDGMHAIDQTSTTLLTTFGAMEVAGTTAFSVFKVADILRQEINTLALITERSAEITNNTSDLVARVQEVLSLFANEIGDYELDVRIVALNAQIAAARVPAAEALNRLAEETNLMADQNGTITRKLLNDLKASLGQLNQVKDSAAEFLTIADVEKCELEAGLVAVTGKLDRLRQRVHHDLTHSRRGFAAAQAKTQSLLNDLKITALIETTFGPAETLCNDLLAASANARPSRHLSADSEAKLEAHRDRYTMQKEATTHQVVLAPTSAATASFAPAAVPSGDSRMDDGIELF